MAELRIQNLGIIDPSQTLLVFGGPYGNLEATRALYDVARQNNIPPEHIICTGDMAAYCADPQETSAFIRDWGIPVIQGNCEQSLMNDAGSCGCGFEDETLCNSLSKQWFDYCNTHVGQDIRSWYRTLPDHIIFTFAGQRFRVVHGSFTHVNQFLFPSDDLEEKGQHIENADADVIICGHNNMQFTQIMDEQCWHNAGVIGMPANDGTPRVWYSTIEAEGDHIVFRHHSLSYDYKTTQQKMCHAALPEGYAACLETGLWPSLDVLPHVERLRAGQPRDEESHILSINNRAIKKAS